MSAEYHRAAIRYLTWLGAVCLMAWPALGIGSVVIWGGTAMTLWGLLPLLLRPRAKPPKPMGPPSKRTCQRRKNCRR